MSNSPVVSAAIGGVFISDLPGLDDKDQSEKLSDSEKLHRATPEFQRSAAEVNNGLIMRGGPGNLCL